MVRNTIQDSRSYLLYNDERLHEALSDLPPAEYEELNIKNDNSRTLAAR